MTKAEFLELLKKYNINEKLVVFDDAIKEGYCVRKNYFRWEVFSEKEEKNMTVYAFLPRAMLYNTYLISFTAYT